jgi:DNA repair exonuclease SbcCD ATPase subunit
MQLQSKLAFQHHELEERDHDIRTLQATLAALHDEVFAAQLTANESVMRKDHDVGLLHENLARMEASAVALNAENEVLLTDLERLRTQAATDQQKYTAMETRCRVELLEAQEHLTMSFGEMVRIEAELVAANDKVKSYQTEISLLTEGMSESPGSASQGGSKSTEELSALESHVESMRVQIATLQTEKQSLLDSQDATVSSTEGKVAGLIAELDALRQGGSGDGEASAQAAELAAIRASLHVHQRKYSEKEAEVRRVEERLLKEVATATCGKDDLLQDLRRSRAHLGTVEQENEVLKWKVQSLERELESGTGATSNATVREIDLIHEVESVKTKLAAAEEQLRVERVERADLEGVAERATAAEAREALAEKQAGELAQELELLQGELDGSLEKLGRLAADGERLRVDCGRCEEDLAHARKEVVDEQEQGGRLTRALAEQDAVHGARVADLEAQLVHAVSSHAAQLGAVQEQLSEAQQRLGEEVEKRRGVETQLSEAQRRLLEGAESLGETHRRLSELTEKLSEVEALLSETQQRLEEESAMREAEQKIQYLASLLPPPPPADDTPLSIAGALTPTPVAHPPQDSNFEALAMKLIEVQEREAQRIAEHGRIQAQLAAERFKGQEKEREVSARVAELAHLQWVLAEENQKVVERDRELGSRKTQIDRLESLLQAATERVWVPDTPVAGAAPGAGRNQHQHDRHSQLPEGSAGTATGAMNGGINRATNEGSTAGSTAGSTDAPPDAASMAAWLSMLEKEKLTADDSLREATEARRALAEAQAESALLAGRVADLEARLAESDEALRLSAEAAKEQENDVRALFADEETRHAQETHELRAEAELCRQQVVAVEAELHSLITAYSTAKQKSETEKLVSISPKKVSKKGVVYKGAVAEDPLPAVADSAVSEGVLRDEVVRLTSANGTLSAQLDQLRAQLGAADERFKRQVEVLLAENQSLSDDLLNAEAQWAAPSGGQSSSSAAGVGAGAGIVVGEVGEEGMEHYDRTALLAEVLKGRQQLQVLTDKLTQVKSKSRKSALETLAVMEDKMIQLENDLDDERIKHERQIVKILKATGLYEKSAYVTAPGPPKPESAMDISDEIVVLFQQQQDDERVKVMALKNCLMQFTHKLNESDLETLLDAGIVLVPSWGQEGKKKGINFRSALCISPSY